MDNFVEILNDLIIESGMSLRQLAKGSGVSANQLSRYLRGCMPTVICAARLADYFECSLDYLFGIVDKKECRKYKPIDLELFIPRYESALNKNNKSHWRFAKETGLSESALRHWKSGDKPSIESLILIAENLSVSIDYLIGRV